METKTGKTQGAMGERAINTGIGSPSGGVIVERKAERLLTVETFNALIWFFNFPFARVVFGNTVPDRRSFGEAENRKSEKPLEADFVLARANRRRT